MHCHNCHDRHVAIWLILCLLVLPQSLLLSFFNRPSRQESRVRSRYSDHAAACRIRGWHPARGNRFVCSPSRPDRPWGPSSFLFNAFRSSLPGLKRPCNEADHSLSFNIEVKNEWIYTSTPLPVPSLHWQGKFYFFLPQFRLSLLSSTTSVTKTTLYAVK